MSKLGGWNIKVSTSGMPQKVVTAMAKINSLLGAKYTEVAYLGNQLANGTNHAVLAEQVVITGEDTKNVVIVTINEKPETIETALVGITPIVEGGGKFGGTNINLTTEIPEDAQQLFNEATAGFVGSNIKPFAFVGTKVVKGIDYKFIAEVTAVTLNPTPYIAVVTVNSMDKKLTFEPVLG